MRLALFDFDGTITTKDTLIEFIKYTNGIRGYYIGLILLSPMLIRYYFKLIPNDIAKERMIAYFFRDWSESHFKDRANRYAMSKIDEIVRPEAIEKIEWHKARGDKVVIVSASMECWIKGWSNRYDMELLSTQLEFVGDKFTGRFKTKNCYGIEKVNRIKNRYNLEDFDYIYAYGDSSGDKEMLSLANESHYKPFRGKLD
ncbi:Phosphoserine phosphatase [hydrothermal vent metagenome]|uniref:Phosphoserine phosphatase n=1 Tax=hydrothermal vent metagenome TaxID=652676 RepID=A0A1W1BFN9_9ZZZZ